MEGWSRVCDVWTAAVTVDSVEICQLAVSRVRVIFNTNNPQLWDYIATSNHWQGLFSVLIQIQMRDNY